MKKIEKINLTQDDFLPGSLGAQEISEKINEIIEAVEEKKFAVQSAGGKARAEKLSPERRSEIAKNAVDAREEKRRKLKGI